MTEVMRLFSIFLCFIICHHVELLSTSNEDMYSRGYEAYQKGMQAQTYNDRQQAFNEALCLFNTLSQGYNNSVVDQALGDTYFQFGKYALALLYYEKALLKSPDNKLVLKHIIEVQQKLGVSIGDHTPSLPKLIQKWMYLFMLCAGIIGVFLILKKKWVYVPWLIFFVCIVTLLCGIYDTASPLKGVVIYSSHLYSSPHLDSPLIQKDLCEGTEGDILEISADKNWLKLRIIDGTIGYILADSVRAVV